MLLPELLTLPLTPALVLPVGFLVLTVLLLVLVLPVFVLPPVLTAALFALAEIAALVVLPEPDEAVTRVVKNEPRTASSSS
jgi:hypothetical protein